MSAFLSFNFPATIAVQRTGFCFLQMQRKILGHVGSCWKKKDSHSQMGLTNGFEARGLRNERFGTLVHLVNPGRPHQTGPPGLAQDGQENSKRACVRPCVQKHNQNPTNMPPERRENNDNLSGRRKKSEIWGPHPSAPPQTFHQPFRAPTPLGPHPSGPSPFSAPLF